MQCAISGVPPKAPVVSPKSGALFEKQLIIEYINEHHKDPISSDPLTLEELIEIKTSPYQPPRQPTLNSIPSLLSSLQNEWDSVALELFQLRKQLDDTRKELSTALYHHDAAVRVASKAIKQRDEARAALQELTISISTGKQIEQQEGTPSNGNGDVQLTDFAPPKDIEELITNASTELFTIHKAQKQKVNVSIGAPLNALSPSGKHETKPYKKIVASNIIDNKAYLTSTTGLTSVFDFQDGKFHKDNDIPKNKNIAFINNVLYNNELTPLIGTISGELIFEDGVQLGEGIHKSPIVSIISHPSLKHLFLSFDKAGVYALHDGTNMTTYYQGKLTNEIVSTSIHTDGALVAVGDVEGTISIIDIRNNEIVKTMETADSTLTNIKFGPNGYWLFAGYTTGDSKFIKVWDLRKDSFETIPLNNQITRILTDKSSQLLVVLGYKSIEIVQYNKKGKEWIGKAIHSVEIDGNIVDGAIVDDSKTDELQVALVTDSSTVQQFTISS